MVERPRPDYSQLVGDLSLLDKISQTCIINLSEEITRLMNLRDSEKKEEIEIHRKRVLLENLERAITSRERIQRAMIGSSLIEATIDRSLDILSSPTADPLRLAESLTDSVSSISIPSEDSQLATKVILTEEESGKSNIAIVRVGVSSTSVVFINGFTPGDVEVPAVVLDIKDGGESGVTINGLNTIYSQSPANDGRVRFLQKPSTKPPEFLEIHSNRTESRLENFFGAKNYQNALTLMGAK